MISLWLNTVIPIIVIAGYQIWIDIAIKGLFKGIKCLLLFNVGVFSNGYHVKTQSWIFGHDLPKQTSQSVEYCACADNA